MMIFQPARSTVRVTIDKRFKITSSVYPVHFTISVGFSVQADELKTTTQLLVLTASAVSLLDLTRWIRLPNPNNCVPRLSGRAQWSMTSNRSPSVLPDQPIGSSYVFALIFCSFVVEIVVVSKYIIFSSSIL